MTTSNKAFTESLPMKRMAAGCLFFDEHGNVLLVKPTVDQTEHRERFKQAAAYGKSVLANPATCALYEAVAKEKDMHVFALTVADFFNAPASIAWMFPHTRDRSAIRSASWHAMILGLLACTFP
jgi:hypothetical protein